MKRLLKIIIICLIIAGLLISALAIPIPQKTIEQLAPSVLLEYNRVGSIAGYNDRIKVYNNGWIEFTRGTTRTLQLPEDNLQELNKFIQNKEYKIKKVSLWEDYNHRQIIDALYISILINANGKTIIIDESSIISQIIAYIDNQNP